jgi:gliding motility-associated-like protein
MRSCLVIVLLFLSSTLAAQFSAGVDDTINPGVPVTLTASYGLIANGVATTDDGVEGPFPIGFSFSFFGDIFTQFYIGANGWISFLPNANSKGWRDAFAVPSPGDKIPKSCILGPFQDMDPSQLGSPYIFYLTTGKAPGRKLIVMWCECPLYSESCRDSLVTFQIILNEGSNTIENHLMLKSMCPDHLANKATLGIQNSTGYVGFTVPAVPSRNATSWRAEKEAWRYAPTSADSFQVAAIPYQLQAITPGEKISYRWYQGTDFLSDQQSLVVTPGETTTYYAFCTLCGGQEFTDTVTVHVVPYIPNAFTPNGDGLNDKFRILGLPPENITRFNLKVFNRWGQMIFQTNDILEAWDGSLNGEVCPEGVYPWVIYYEDNSKTKVSNKGTVTLVR